MLTLKKEVKYNGFTSFTTKDGNQISIRTETKYKWETLGLTKVLNLKNMSVYFHNDNTIHIVYI